jgi:hypothetical protein
LADFGGEWDKINNDKLVAFINRINEAADALDRLSMKPGSLEEKTAAGKGEYVQKTPYTKGVEDDWNKLVKKLLALPVPAQPSAGAMPGVTSVQKPPTGEGTITAGGKTYSTNEPDTLTVGGKAFDLKNLSEAEGKIKDMSGRILADINEVQENVIKSAEESSKRVLASITEAGTLADAALVVSTTKATAGIDELAGAVDEVVSTTKATAGIEELTNAIDNIPPIVNEIDDEVGNLGINVDSVKSKVTEMYDKIVEVVANPITELITQGALGIMNSAKATLEKIKSDWDSLKSKTITLTINTVEAGGGGGSGEDTGSSDSGGSGGMSDYGGSRSSGDIGEHRTGGLVGSLTKALNQVYSFAQGGKLPGYGGGDRIPVMAEAGEYVVNKASTSKFLPIIEAINSNAVSVADFGKRFGGAVKTLKRKSNVFQIGGPSQPGYSLRGDNSSLRPVEVHFHPTYMNGDRAMARRFAVDIKRELDELDRRSGR